MVPTVALIVSAPDDIPVTTPVVIFTEEWPDVSVQAGDEHIECEPSENAAIHVIANVDATFTDPGLGVTATDTRVGVDPAKFKAPTTGFGNVVAVWLKSVVGT